MRTVRIGTRASKLAVIQAELLARAISDANPDIQTVLVPMTTTGDRILDRPLDAIGGKGLFVRELDQALLDHRVDITVHSCKDLPMELDERLPVVAVSKREDPSDVLVLPKGSDTLDDSLPIGCSSARRRIQLRDLYPQHHVRGVRGNVLTRLSKLDAGDTYAALALASAGLRRLGLEERIYRSFTPDEMIPAACQGMIAVQARSGEDTAFLEGFHDGGAWLCMLAERAFIRALGGGCSAPCAAYASLYEEGLQPEGATQQEGTLRHEGMAQHRDTRQPERRMRFRGLYVSEDESRVVSESTTLHIEGDLEEQAKGLAERMKNHE